MKTRSVDIVLVSIRLFGLGLSCSKDDLCIIPNAFTKCPTNDSCEAKCYRGYIFPDGNTTTVYSCQNEDWTPVASACKQIPITHIKYEAIWAFSLIPSECDNISIRLISSKEMLEEEFLNSCNRLPINLIVHFIFQTLAFQMTTTFSAAYTNFTERKIVEKCSSLILITFKNNSSTLFNNLFQNITCENQAVNYRVFKNLSISDQYEQCPIGMDVRNITTTTSDEETVEHYCDFAVTRIFSKSVTEQSTTTLTNIKDTTIYSIDQTDLNATTAVTTISPDNEPITAYPAINTSAESIDTQLSINVIYIGASVGGASILMILVIVVVVVVVVCRKKRNRELTELNLYQSNLPVDEAQHMQSTTEYHFYDVMEYNRK